MVRAAGLICIRVDRGNRSPLAWLDLRNKAAHGQYNEYTKEQ
jgi:hypothetical protein